MFNRICSIHHPLILFKTIYKHFTKSIYIIINIKNEKMLILSSVKTFTTLSNDQDLFKLRMIYTSNDN